MKITKLALAIWLCISIISCSSNDDPEDLTGQTGTLVLKFDNGVGDQDFIFGTSYTKSNNESFKLETLKYIISNVRLTNSEGQVVTTDNVTLTQGDGSVVYQANDNAFIVNEAYANNAGEIWVTIKNIPAANYTNVQFGIGLTQERYSLGAAGQGAFLDFADAEGLMWSWATGYKFMLFEGSCNYNDGTTDLTDQSMMYHMGSQGNSVDNYRETSLDLPNTIYVREDKTPQVHIEADILKIIEGEESSFNFADGYAVVMMGAKGTEIAENFKHIFKVHHVHNQ